MWSNSGLIFPFFDIFFNKIHYVTVNALVQLLRSLLDDFLLPLLYPDPDIIVSLLGIAVDRFPTCFCVGHN